MSHRYFTTDIFGDAARLTGPDAAHLARVLRAKPGLRVTLCDGAGTDYAAEVSTATPERVELRVLSRAPSLAEPALSATVYIGMAKGERMDYAVQKSVELGAAAIVPFYSQNCVVKPKNDEEKTRRYTRIATEAAKQCGRGLLPPVAAPVSFADVLRLAAAHPLCLFLYESGGIPLRQALGQGAPGGLPRGGEVGIITGPEGGFTPGEAGAAAAAGFATVHLGPRILRCETAPAAVLAAVMALTGNLE